MASSLSSFLPTSYLGFHPLSNSIKPSSLITPPISISRFASKVVSQKSSFSYGDVGREQLKRSRYTASVNPKERDIVKDNSKESEAQGPPVLTILAGVLVFFLVFWIIGSIVTWLVSLVINLSPTK